MKSTTSRHVLTAIAPRLLIGVSVCLASGNSTVAETPIVKQVACGEAASVKFEVELITDTAGNQAAGGVGRCCWGFNQSNLVRHGENVYAMCWRDDQHLVVFRRGGVGGWQASPPLPKVPQNGVLLADSLGRVHVIGGEAASYHVIFDPPGQIQEFTIGRHARADSRFGASIRADDDILVAGGLPGMTWYMLDASRGYQPVASGRVPHPTARAYYFVVFHGEAGHTFCYDDYFVEGTGYHTLKTYYHYNPDVLRRPDDWRMTVVSDVSETLEGHARGTTENEELLVDRKGRVHMLYMRNTAPSTTRWASEGQDRSRDELYHVVGPPGGPFQHYLLGNFSRGRLYQTSDGRFHYLMARGEWFSFDLWYAAGEDEEWGTISRPVQLDTPDKIDHVFVNSTRAGGTLAPVVDCYFTGPYPGRNNLVWYGWLTPKQ